MRIGITLRNMGLQSTRQLMADCARRVDGAGLDSLWITDHIAIAPDDAEGSGGRYLDTLVTLGWLAAQTRHVRLGSGVLILPYRPELPTAKAIATVQELSAGRLLLGVGVGWMEAEFRALGIPRSERGRRTDHTLEFLAECFSAEVTVANGQPFLFRPQPPRPPIYIGGSPPHAIARTLRHGDGWLPMGTNPARLQGPIAELHQRARTMGRPRPAVIAMGALPLKDLPAAREQCQSLAAIGVDQVVCAVRYDTYTQYAMQVEALARLRADLG